ncbi:MAG TPA: response regulator [Prolixibacteraceae bacterium]|jgi:signal transduction histidine kinase/CheY-like chemotaxis protein/HAMP domain-containing protein
MKLENLRIGTQMKLGFGIVIMLIVVLGAISWQQTNKIEQHIINIYEHPFTVRKALGNLNSDILGMRLEFRNFLLAKDNKDREIALANSQFYEIDIEQQFNQLEKSYLGPQDDIVEARKAFLRWVAVRNGNRDLGMSGKIEEAMDRVQDTGDVGMEREQLLKCINKIDQFASNKAAEYLAVTSVLKKTLDRQLGMLVSMILALTILIVYLLNRNIRRPIVELSAVTQQFMEGKTDVRCSYQMQNEFGQLSESFNHLADAIETELILNDQAARLAEVMLSKDDAHDFCHSLLSSLLGFTGAQMGAVYLLNVEKTEFEHFESLGIGSEGRSSFSALDYEGEFGAALASQQLQHITDIPEDTRFEFSTVSGKFTPREMVTIPIVTGNETVAVISLATIKSFSENNLRLLHSILSTLSARIHGILTYQKVIKFAQQLEYQNSELEAQKRELSVQTNELTGQNVELEMQKKQLDEANRMKTSFLSNMSHELRTPLNSVIALSGVLNRRLVGKVPDEEHSYLDVIERNGKQLLLLINDILDLSRIESGYEEVEIRKFDVSELIHAVTEVIEPQVKQKGIYLRNTTEGDLPAIKCDYEKCYHILQNLVANAVKFTEVGGVDLSVQVKGETIHIIVSDTGIGIEKEHLPHIFDEFRQADGSNSRKYGGTGLGLAIAKKYTHMLGGQLLVDSTPGKGSQFTLVLPLQCTSGEANNTKPIDRTELTRHVQQPIHTDGRNKTILLVEDAEAIIIQMNEILSAQGYRIMVARNGSEALEQISQQIPDAMILDLMMPEVDGFEVLKRIREEEKTDHLPVIILTAKYVTKEELAFLKNNGIRQLIQKGDINKDQLLEAVSGMMMAETTEHQTPAKRLTKVHQPGAAVVLVVEDNPDNMLTIRALLDGKCTIIQADDGLAVIDLASLHLPHLILMDIALPGQNGIETLAELRKVEALKNIPVIAVSASAMKGDREDFIAYGFDDYISKPIDSNLFEKTIKQYLN